MTAPGGPRVQVQAPIHDKDHGWFAFMAIGASHRWLCLSHRFSNWIGQAIDPALWGGYKLAFAGIGVSPGPWGQHWVNEVAHAYCLLMVPRGSDLESFDSIFVDELTKVVPNMAQGSVDIGRPS